MNSATSVVPQPSGQPCHGVPEKVGLRRVRLSLSRQCLSASVGSFFAADKVLLDWATRHQGPLEFNFEIIYDDDRTLAGDYRFQHGTTTRPSLMGYVRKNLIALCEGKGKGTPVRGLVDGPQRFLAHYETDDFFAI
jgi:hypothetical protein